MNRHVLAYNALMILNLMLAAFLVQLATGHVPIPEGWAWLIPVAIAGLTGLTALLPKLSSVPSLPPGAAVTSNAGTVTQVATTRTDTPPVVVGNPLGTNPPTPGDGSRG